LFWNQFFFSCHLTAFISLSISQQGSPEFGRHNTVDFLIIYNKISKIEQMLTVSQQDPTTITQP